MPVDYYGMEGGYMGTGLSPLQQLIMKGSSPEGIVKLLSGAAAAVGVAKRTKKRTKKSSSSRSSSRGKFKNIKIKKKGGGTRTQRVQVLASGKYKFVKNK